MTRSLLKFSALLSFLLWSFMLFSQFSSDSLIHFEIQGNDTDPFITLDGAKKHQVLFNPTSQTQNTLLLHLVGSIDNPNSTILYPTEAANNGFHCINLAYRNSVSGEAACGDVPDVDCHYNYRKEIIEGIDYSSAVNVNAANSINNRLIKLLQYLDANYPNQNWAQFYSGNTVDWSKFIVSGHSQGGGHAAVIGITEPIQRVLMFGSPNDYSDTLNSLASWTSLPHLVPDSNYYSFNALYDEVIDFWKQYAHSDALNLDNFGDTVNVDLAPSPYSNSRQLYTEEIVISPNPLEFTHNVMIRDAETPTDISGNPLFSCVWKYMLGIECGTNSINDAAPMTNLNVYPNPAKNTLWIEIDLDTAHPKQLVIRDLFGRILVSENTLSSGKNGINIEELPNGIYTVQLMENAHLVASARIIKN